MSDMRSSTSRRGFRVTSAAAGAFSLLAAHPAAAAGDALRSQPAFLTAELRTGFKPLRQLM